jgi:hypothetical protein
MGNQLFQFAAAKALQPDPDDPVVVDSRFVQLWGKHLGRVLLRSSFREVRARELVALGHVPRLPRGQTRAEAARVRLTRARALVRRFDRTFHETPLLGFDPRILEVTPPTLLAGYFQSEEYFVNRSPGVIASFRPEPAECHALQRSVSAEAKSRPVIGVSLRSGADYRRARVVLHPAYYRRAAELLTGQLGAPYFVVIGDVVDDARDLCALLAEFGPVSSYAHLPPETQLHLLAHQPHAILANSTFAWWGGWLGDHKYRGEVRHVIRPRPWLRTPPGEICPSRWTALDVRFASNWRSFRTQAESTPDV